MKISPFTCISHYLHIIVESNLPKSTRLVQGDKNAQKILECLSYVAALYGEQVILLQYIPCVIDMVRSDYTLTGSVFHIRQVSLLL